MNLQGVGKTCLLLRYANESFSPTFITTIGIDFKIKNIALGGKRIKLQIWDTAGQERFRTITTSYFRGAQGILLVYDVTDRQTFLSIRNWVQQIQVHADVNVNKVLIGNKCDMEDRSVDTEEGAALAQAAELVIKGRYSRRTASQTCIPTSLKGQHRSLVPEASRRRPGGAERSGCGYYCGVERNIFSCARQQFV